MSDPDPSISSKPFKSEPGPGDLRELESNFEALFHRSPVAMSITDCEHGLFVDVNESFLRDSGWPRDQVIGHSATELGLYVNPDDRRLVIEKVKRQGEARGIEVTFRQREGTNITCLMSTCLILLQGRPHFLSVLQDISEQKQAHGHLAEQLRELRRWQDATLGR